MKSVLVCLLLSLLPAGVCYIACGSIVLSAGVFAVYFASLLLLAAPKVLALRRKRRIRKECYRFMNSFVTTCSVTSSLSKAYDVSIEGAAGEEKEVIDASSANGIEGKLKALASYYESQLYEVFLSIVDIYQERGGDIIGFASSLLEEATRIEEEGESKMKQGQGKLFQYGSLWAMSLGIVAFLRFALSSFYATLMASSTYLACLGIYFVLLLLGLHIYCHFYTGEKGTMKVLRRRKNGKGN